MKPVVRPFARSGFTLIELVISSAVGAMILVCAYLCLNAGITSQRMIEPRSEAAQNARVAFAILSADLRSACPLSKDFEFIGMDRTLEGIEADNMDFATHNYSPVRPGEGDFCQVSYFVDRGEDGTFSLWRRRNPIIAPDPLEGGGREEIARHLQGVRFEYFDGFDWYDSWGDTEARQTGKTESDLDTNVSGMPEAVRITLWFDSEARRRGPDDSGIDSAPSLVFQTVVRLELAAASQKDDNSTGGGAN